MSEYFWLIVNGGAFFWLLVKHAPLQIIMLLWLGMMAWETYDLHADHAFVISLPFGFAAYKAAHRPVERVAA